MPAPNKAPKQFIEAYGPWITVGISLGVVFGLAFHNLGLWLSLGVVFGIVAGKLR